MQKKKLPLLPIYFFMISSILKKIIFVFVVLKCICKYEGVGAFCKINYVYLEFLPYNCQLNTTFVLITSNLTSYTLMYHPILIY